MLILCAFLFAVASFVYFQHGNHPRIDFKPIQNNIRQHFKALVIGKSPSNVEIGPEDSVKHLRNIYPPSRRKHLQKLPHGVSKDAAYQNCENTSGQSRSKPLPLDQVQNTLDDDFVTPTGFSLGEIRKLGRFPNYSIISGVPLPENYENFDFDRAIPRPYRPFRWKYFQTMSLSKLDPDWWLELSRDYRAKVQHRVALFHKYGPQILQALPGSEYQCQELIEIVIQFLCARHSNLFQLSEDKTIFHNRILGTDTNLLSIPPLHFLIENVPEDFAVMIRNPDDGLYYFRAGVICHAQGWTLATKIGKQLGEIHSPVPHFKEKMAMSMDRYFAKMPTDSPIQRGSWGLELDEPMFMPPGDHRESFHAYQVDPARLVTDLTSEDQHCHKVSFRVEWQTLRRLPLTGAVVFNFKGIYTPLEKLRHEPYIPRLLLKVLNEGEANLMVYKKIWHVEHVVKPWLGKWAKEQEQQGIVPSDWQECTLEEHPFFPGWEEKWHMEQGF